MRHNTILTSKGTTTIPAEIRKQLGIKPGMYISFTQDKVSGDFIIKKAQTIDELRVLNKNALKKAKTSSKNYESGMGYEQFIVEKYGS